MEDFNFRKEKKMKNVLVTTDKRGVFFGELSEEDNHFPEKLTLKKAQNCISWSSSVKGVFGLAATGPNSDCRVGPVVEELELAGITSITKVSDEAAEAWRKQPWN